MKDLTVILENSPGKFADLGELLGKNDINMEGEVGIPLKDEAFIHILVEDAIKTRSILEQAGYQVTSEREALLSVVLLAFSYHHIWFSQNAR